MSSEHISHYRVRKYSSYPSTSSELKRKEVGKELSPITEETESQEESPKELFSYIFSTFKHSSSCENPCN